MRRRQMLLSAGAAVLGPLSFPLGWAAGAEKDRQKVLLFTQSGKYEHDVVRRRGNELSFAEKALTAMGKKAGFDVTCSKDGRLFDADLDQYDAFAFFTNGDLTQPNKQNTPPMTPRGKQRLLDAIAAGKGFVGFHCAAYTFTSGPMGEVQSKVDPYIAMLGGELCAAGPHKAPTLTVASPHFPGIEGLGKSLRLRDEAYALKHFAADLHVILTLQTEGMKTDCYRRPPFPMTWARKHGKGRVFYTSLGHREDVWTSDVFQQIVLGGFAWVLGNADADVRPNINRVAPKARQIKEGTK